MEKWFEFESPKRQWDKVSRETRWENVVGNEVGNDVGEERQEGKLKRAVGKGEKREVQLEKERVEKSKWNEIEMVKRKIEIKWALEKRILQYLNVSLWFPSISIIAKQQGYSIKANKKKQ